MADAVTFREMKLESGWLMIRPERQDLGKAMAAVRKHKDRLYDLEIKEHREKRSLSANAYAWVLIDKLAKAQGITPLEVYRYAIQNIGGNTEIMLVPDDGVDKFRRIWEAQGMGWICRELGPSTCPGHSEMLCYYGSSTYSSKQMALLIDSLVQDCNALDIETWPPEKLALLVEGWNAK